MKEAVEEFTYIWISGKDRKSQMLLVKMLFTDRFLDRNFSTNLNQNFKHVQSLLVDKRAGTYLANQLFWFGNKFLYTAPHY